MSKKMSFYKIVLYVLVCFFISGFLACTVAQKEYDGKIQKPSFFTSQNTDNSPQDTGKDDDTKPNDKPDTGKPPQDTSKDDDTKPNDKPDTDEPSQPSKLYIIGGYTKLHTVNVNNRIVFSNYANDIWSFGDDTTWRRETARLEFLSRGYHQVVLFKGKMYLIGGYYDNEPKNDVWSSKDGKAWEDVKPTGDIFPARRKHQVVVFKDRMYVIGGDIGDGSVRYENDVWSSEDGKAWKKATITGDIFSARTEHQVAVFQGRMYLIGGYDTEYKNDVWSSEDGKAWKKATTTGDIFSARKEHQVAVFQGKMYVIGGYDTEYKNDVWSSEDGKVWKKATTTGDIFSARKEHQVAVFQGKMYVIGGYDTEYTNDVWSSRDGVTWRQEETVKGKKFPARSRHQVVVFPAE